jgi:uroporphyrinogen decarboxylase
MFKDFNSKIPSDFISFEKVLRGEKKPEKIYFIELRIDEEIIRYFIENVWGEKWVPLTENTLEQYQSNWINFYYRMGYDCARIRGSIFWENMPQFKESKIKDTAILSRCERTWVTENSGVIKNWEDFNKINWDKIKYNFKVIEYTAKALPEGMKILVGSSLFETVLEKFLGYEGLFILSYDNPELVSAVIEKWGKILYEFYKEAIQYPEVGAIFHPDDLGSKNSTLINPDFLRKNVLPWLKKYVSLAHKQRKMFWYHCCGNVLDIMHDLIYDVKIDAFHSFQDQIIPIDKFIHRYPSIAALGGIDMDNLGRMKEQELRKYVRKILSNCMPGKYALGSGNSIANYIPIRNYLAILEEGLKWK